MPRQRGNRPLTSLGCQSRGSRRILDMFYDGGTTPVSSQGSLRVRKAACAYQDRDQNLTHDQPALDDVLRRDEERRCSQSPLANKSGWRSQPYDALLVVSFAGPDGPDDVCRLSRIVCAAPIVLASECSKVASSTTRSVAVADQRSNRRHSLPRLKKE